MDHIGRTENALRFSVRRYKLKYGVVRQTGDFQLQRWTIKFVNFLDSVIVRIDLITTIERGIFNTMATWSMVDINRVRIE